VTAGRALAPPSGYVDQVARREQFELDHPGTEISHDAPDWAGSLMVGRTRRRVTARGLGPLLDRLDRLALLAADVTAIEADFPGWRVWLSDVGRWWAVRQGTDSLWTRGRNSAAVTLHADDAAGLRGLLAADAATDAG
jgi:hypothetical protein